jgi:hypothetical protein
MLPARRDGERNLLTEDGVSGNATADKKEKPSTPAPPDLNPQWIRI